MTGGQARTISLDGEADEAWRVVRRQLPADLLVIRPEWLPGGVSSRVLHGIGHVPPEWRYDVAYRSDDDRVFISFIRGPTYVGGQGLRLETTTVRGRSAKMLIGSRPALIVVSWDEQGRSYHIQARGLSRDEMRRVVASLVEVR